MKNHALLPLCLALLLPFAAQGKPQNNNKNTTVEEVKLEVDEDGVTLIRDAEEFNVLFRDMSKILQKSRAFRFEGDWAKSIDDAINKTLWWNYMNGYYFFSGQKGMEFAPMYKDSTRMLTTFMDEDMNTDSFTTKDNRDKKKKNKKNKNRKRDNRARNAAASANAEADADTEAPARDKITDEERKALQEMEKRLAELVQPEMTVPEIIRAVHDDLVNRATYSQKMDYGQKCTNMVLHDEGVCEAYSRYMYLALNMLGIPCHSVYGQAGGPHAWNMVKIGENWYHLDATWDDPICNGGKVPMLRHTYFCISDKTISQDHQWEREAYPATPETDFNGAMAKCDTYDAFAQRLIQAYESGLSSFEAELGAYTSKTELVEKLKEFMEGNKHVRISKYHVHDGMRKTLQVMFDRKASKDSPVSEPEELEVSVPVETEESAAGWTFRSGDAQLDQATWEDFLKSSENVLKNSINGTPASSH